MYDSWSCLMVEKGPGVITDEVRAALKMAACNLSLKKIDRSKINSEVCDGIIQTAWDSHIVGSRSGILFRAQITEKSGDYFVNFLLNEDDLKQGGELLRQLEEKRGGSWTAVQEPFPLKELHVFYDLRPHKLN